MKTTRKIGQQMLNAVAIVSEHQGCTKKFVAERISPHPVPRKNWALGYEPVNRAISAGLLCATRMPNGRYSLTAPAADAV